ncbi:MAG: HsmA family protein [Gammaproteobacteria bacterium]
MKPIILVSVISITTALIVYTIAVWSNWRAKVLGTVQIVLLWIGLAADATATRMMGLSAGKTTWDFHTISGNLGLGLMAILAVVGTWAKLTRRDDILASFHKYAVPVWIIWVISYATGVIIGVQRA